MTGWAESCWLPTDPEPPSDGPVVFGGTLAPENLLSAYRHGLLPMPCDKTEGAQVNALLYGEEVVAGRIRVVSGRTPTFGLAWWSPDPRPVLTAGSVRLSSGLTKTLRTHRAWTTTVNECFERVLMECGAGREPRWLTHELTAAMTDLHGQGWYHSVEVWSGTELVGGAVGLGLGRVFSCDTMFHRVGGASQVALADLAVRMDETTASTVDLQWDSAHVRRIGARFMDRSGYLALAGSSADPVDPPLDRRSVDDLLDRLRHRHTRPDCASCAGHGWA